jgi:tousled-like kinase
MYVCRGTDLDERLKKMRTVPEKDCKVVVMQVLSGLRYLNTPSEGDGAEPRRKAIIHYDLKPANILFDEFGDVKITDFGLSKIIDDDVVGTSIELTSQGSGTYWYLPPECSEPHAVISPKVDIWSLGVIFYQMLFGKRPFGEGKSQEQVLREGIMVSRHSTSSA